MKSIKFLAVLIGLALPSLAFSQDLDLNDKQLYQPDPFKKYMLKADNPCNNSQYLELQNDPRNENTDQKYAIFTLKARKCQDYLTSIKDSKPAPQVEVSTQEGDPWKPFLILGASAVVVSVGIIILR